MNSEGVAQEMRDILGTAFKASQLSQPDKIQMQLAAQETQIQELRQLVLRQASSQVQPSEFNSTVTQGFIRALQRLEVSTIQVLLGDLQSTVPVKCTILKYEYPENIRQS